MLHISYREHFFEAADGTQLYRRSWGKGDKGIFLLVHGFAEHLGRHQILAKALVEEGYCVEAFDCRGHGRSNGLRAYIQSFQEYVDDLAAFIKEVQLNYPVDTPCFLFGHSQGAHIVLRYAIEKPSAPLNGIIVSSPFLGLAIKVPSIQKMIVSFSSRFLPKLPLFSQIKEEELTHDKAVIESTKRDPLYLNIIRTRWFTETLQAQKDTMERASSLKLPLLMQQAGDDRIVDKKIARKFFEKLGSSDTKRIEYSDSFHEIYNETPERREHAISDLKMWLEQHTS